MIVKATVIRIEPMQTTSLQNDSGVQEMRSQAFLLKVGDDLLWAERRSPLLTPYRGDEFDKEKPYQFLLRSHIAQKNGTARKFYNTFFSIEQIQTVNSL